MAWQRYKVPVILGSAGIFFISVSLLLLFKTTQTVAPIQFIPAPPRPAALSSSTALARISINSALQEDLEALPGIGPVTAKKIIDNRPYGSLEELVEKKAMGQALFKKLKDQLVL